VHIEGRTFVSKCVCVYAYVCVYVCLSIFADRDIYCSVIKVLLEREGS